MISERKMQQAVREFCDNKTWKEYYDTAPSDLSKKYIELQFAVSYHCIELSDDEVDIIAEKMHQLEDSYGLDDWKFEYRWSGHNPHKSKCEKKICESIPDIHPFANEGIFDEKTGSKIDIKELKGYLVTFHQNESLANPYGGYSDEDYADMCAIAAHELETNNCCINSYEGYAIVSFICSDRAKSYMFAVQHNQHSTYDLGRDIVLINLFYDKSKNPMKDI